MNREYETLKAACELFADSYPPPARTRPPLTLDTVGVNLLAQKIALLPEGDQALLFCRYSFRLDAEAVGSLLELSHPQQRLDCCRALLAAAMGVFGELSDASIGAACGRAMVKLTAEYRQPQTERSAAQKAGRTLRAVFRYLAVAAVAAALTAAIALAASPALRERVFRWVVNTFPQYSQIGPGEVATQPTEADFERLTKYRPNYVPEGYRLDETILGSPLISSYYMDSHENRLDFNGHLPTGDFTYYNSENALIETLSYLGQPAYYWEKDGFSYFIWQQDGFQFDIIGKIAKEEALKMATSTKFEE